MKALTLTLALALSTGALSQSIGAQDIEPMLQQMRASGKITEEQLEATREHMKTMNPSDWAKIQRDAEDKVKRHPASTKKVEEGGLDALDPKDFGIEMPAPDQAN